MNMVESGVGRKGCIEPRFVLFSVCQFAPFCFDGLQVISVLLVSICCLLIELLSTICLAVLNVEIDKFSEHVNLILIVIE